MTTADVLLFVKVAETLSFKEAARQLCMSRSQASKRIAAMEGELGTMLVYRSPRSISLTRAGETLLQHYRPIADLVEEAKLAVERLGREPVGKLRFSIPTCLGAALLPKLYDDFAAQYPEVVLDVHMSESCVDVVGGGYDVVIRVARKLSDSALTAKRLATSPLVLAASPSYLARRGTPKHVVELTSHRCLGLATEKPQAASWHFNTPSGPLCVPVKLSPVTDTNLALVVAACAGIGFVYVPQAVIANELARSALCSVLPEFCTGIEWGVYALYPGRSPTINARLFIDYVQEALPNLQNIDRWSAVNTSRAA